MVKQDINSILKQGIKLGISAVTLSNSEGLVIASQFKGSLDKKITAAMASLAYSTAQRVKEELNLGIFRDITIRGDKGVVFIKGIKLKKDYVIITSLIKPPVRYFIRKMNNMSKEIQNWLNKI
ncbi:MAG: roadblock/LC7 domain-containing protein [Candidatus Ranarchaeia archaeon]